MKELRFQSPRPSARLKKALPATLPRHVRDDVTSDIVVAILEGRLQLSQLATKAQKYLAAHNYTFDRFGSFSLDEPIPGTDGLTYSDRLVYEEGESFGRIWGQ
jgi:hypothetical protein